MLLILVISRRPEVSSFTNIKNFGLILV